MNTDIPNSQTPILGHGAKYTNYGIFLPQPCPPPSNLFATAWEKQIKSSLQESDHALPCPTLWFFKSKADGHVWKEEGLLAAKDWTPKGTYIAEQKQITPISAVDNKKKRFYKTLKLQIATKICGCDV